MMIYALAALTIILATLGVFFWLRYSKLNIEFDFTSKELAEAKHFKNSLDAEKLSLIKDNEALSAELKHHKQLIQEFKKLKEESKETNKAVLFDLGNKLSKQLIDLHKKENQESRELSEQNIKKTSAKFNNEFERVVNMVGSLNKEISQSKDTVDIIKNSLLSPSGAGALAEITLENILKSSGLKANIDFMMQYSVSGEDENSILRPDSVIFLPSNKLMVIDAKASKFLVDEKENLQKLAKTMNNHLRSLSSKNYAQVVRKDVEGKLKDNPGNIVTLMFLPSEHAIEKLCEADPEFMNKAWRANIFPVGPAGLMNMLSFAKFQISEQLMMHNNIQIIEEIKKLIAAIHSMSEHSNRLGNSIASAVNNYDKFAASFNRNFLSKAKKIGNMGVSTDSKKEQTPLQRMQVVTSKAELIDVAEEGENEAKSAQKKLETS